MGDKRKAGSEGMIEWLTAVCAGIMIGWFQYNIVIHLGELIMMAVLGYRLLQLDFWGLRLVYENGSYSFHFTNFTLKPSVQIIEEEIDSVFDRVRKVLLEIIPMFLVLAMIVCEYLFLYHPGTIQGKIVLCAILVTSLFLIELLCIAIWMLHNTFGSGEGAVFHREEKRVIGLLKQGISPKDIDFHTDGFDSQMFRKEGRYVWHRRYDLFRYYQALESGNWNMVQTWIPAMEQMISPVWKPSDTPYYYEALYYYSAVNRDLSKAESYANQIGHVVAADHDCNGRRVYAAYLYYTGKDRNLARQVAQEGISVSCQLLPKGMEVMEKKLLMDLLQKMEEE